MSIYIIFTPFLKRGYIPKCKIQFNLAPAKIMTSAPPKAVDLAGPTQLGCSSEIKPLPLKLLFIINFFLHWSW